MCFRFDVLGGHPNSTKGFAPLVSRLLPMLGQVNFLSCSRVLLAVKCYPIWCFENAKGIKGPRQVIKGFCLGGEADLKASGLVKLTNKFSGASLLRPRTDSNTLCPRQTQVETQSALFISSFWGHWLHEWKWVSCNVKLFGWSRPHLHYPFIDCAPSAHWESVEQKQDQKTLVSLPVVEVTDVTFSKSSNLKNRVFTVI